ncbi:MAG: asparagine synthase (glutamine-hydrolyzing), partial [Sphingomonas sp.]
MAGLYARRRGPVPPRLIAAQCDTILHRGPDDQGVLTDGDFGFGMRRLSVIDIAGGHQPSHSPDGRYVIVFNGEIYNFVALRRDLMAQGRQFRTAGDTEVILAGYERWGDDVWAKLDGMFAVAVWDTQERRLTLARDPIGIKPLYYTDRAAGFAFGSELKTLTLLPGMAFDVDRRALHDYFSFGHVRTPRSIYAQVRTLPPGHVMTVEASGTPTMRAYWTPAYHLSEPRSEAEWIERFRDEWLDTIGKQMVADVDVDAFLSGGVDSSAVVAAMARVSDRPVRTFTIGFPDPRFDESPHAE